MDGWRVIWSAQKNSPKDGELTGRHENNSPKGWTDGELNGWQKNNFRRDG